MGGRRRARGLAADNWRHLLGIVHPGEAPRLAAQHYLQDQVHVSKRGERLMEVITARHFEYRPKQPPTWLDRIRAYQPDGSRWPETGDEYPSGGTVMRQPLKFEFTGNRIDLIAAPVDGKPGSAKILIDGRPPSTIPEIFTATRTTLIPGSPWPMIKHVQAAGRPVAEDWTLTYTTVAPQTTAEGRSHFELKFDLAGSVTGPDGSGSTRERFVSTSGRIVIEPEWFLPGAFWNSTGAKAPQVGTQVRWQTKRLGLDVWKPGGNLDPATEDRHVVAQGLANGKHTLEIIPNDDGPIALRAVVVHQPNAL